MLRDRCGAWPADPAERAGPHSTGCGPCVKPSARGRACGNPGPGRLEPLERIRGAAESGGLRGRRAVRSRLRSEAPGAGCPRLSPRRGEREQGVSLPNMEGAHLLADGTTLGVAMTCQGLWGLGLVELAPWRKAIGAGVPIRCEGEPVLITGPTWIARESEGRASPAAQRSPGGASWGSGTTGRPRPDPSRRRAPRSSRKRAGPVGSPAR